MFCTWKWFTFLLSHYNDHEEVTALSKYNKIWSKSQSIPPYKSNPGPPTPIHFIKFLRHFLLHIINLFIFFIYLTHWESKSDILSDALHLDEKLTLKQIKHWHRSWHIWLKYVIGIHVYITHTPKVVFHPETCFEISKSLTWKTGEKSSIKKRIWNDYICLLEINYGSVPSVSHIIKCIQFSSMKFCYFYLIYIIAFSPLQNRYSVTNIQCRQHPAYLLRKIININSVAA